MTPETSSKRSSAGHLLAGVLGGLIVLVVGAVLIATDVIDPGSDRTVVRETPVGGQTVSGDDSEGRTVQDIYRQEGPGVVFISARGGSNESPFGVPSEEGTATGSGFVIDKEGYIVTNDHVVEGSDDVSVRFDEDGEQVKAQVKGRDPSSDIALLKVDPDDAKLAPVPLGDSAKVNVGDPVVAIGNPFGINRTVTTGIVSGVQREIQAPNGFTIAGAIQTDAAVNPGNSGGPLLNADGEVIGINSQIATGGGNGSVGIAFAVPVNTLKRDIPELKDTGKVSRPYIGVTTGEVTKQLAEDLNLPVTDGALVVDVRPESPASRAGLRAGQTQTLDGQRIGGDLIVGIDGKDVSGPEDVSGAIEEKKPGDTVELEYIRRGDRKTTKVKLGERPDDLGQGQQEEPQQPLIP